MIADVELLKSIFRYEPTTGKFFWLVDRSGGAHGGFVKARKGEEAGRVDPSNGYVRLRSGGRKWLAHRAAWMLAYGHAPVCHIDHINGIKTDNRLANLRDVDRSTNLQNRKAASAKNKSSGVLGVQARRGKFMAVISVDGKSRILGTYTTAEAAHEQYVTAKRQLHAGNTL